MKPKFKCKELYSHFIHSQYGFVQLTFDCLVMRSFLPIFVPDKLKNKKNA